MTKRRRWTMAMYERLLRLDGQELADIAVADRAHALRVLSEAFSDVDLARAALEDLERWPRLPWTAHGLRKLRELYPTTDTADIARRLGRRPRQVYEQAHRLGLRKTRAFMREQLARAGEGLRESGLPHRFPKGLKPWNHGLKGWSSGGRSVETRFRKGQMPRLWRPIGAEVVDGDGYLKRKVSDDRTRPSRFNWEFVHVLVWEEHHGPVPTGHAVVFRDGNKRHIEISNLELITRAELMRRNTIHRFPRPLEHAIRLAKKLERTIRRVERERQEQA